jgi:glycosyltransferase involved in cell wall biosynthesis
VQSAEEKERLSSITRGAKISVAPHPVYDMFAGQRMSQEKARQLLGLGSSGPVLLFFGFVREYKGLEDLLAALPEIRAQLGGVSLIVAGEFWENKAPYLAMIEELGITDAVIIDDRYIPNEEVSTYFSAADLLVAPYRRVTGSGVVQMAKGFGLTIVGTNIPAGPDVYLTQSQAPKALADTVIKALTDGRTGSIEAESSSESQPNIEWGTVVKSIERSLSSTAKSVASWT